MISICMGVKNGEQFINAQVDSILPQLGVDDELIISDDHSSDHTLQQLEAYGDRRIKLTTNPGHGIISNFENSLKVSHGDIIFLADQDDVWTPHKIQSMLLALRACDLVVSDCMIANGDLEVERESFFAVNRSGKGVLKNLIRNSYMGCCMAFHRNLLEKALPFPVGTPMHDLWIGLIAEMWYQVRFIPDKLVYHRRHARNASSTSGKSSFSIFNKVSYRVQLATQLLKLRYANHGFDRHL